jgi:choline transporter-like protein 2/4/5
VLLALPLLSNAHLLSFVSYLTGWIFVGGTAIFLLVIIALRSRIKIAVEVVKEASRAINDVKSIVFFPILPIFLAIAYSR